MQQRGNVDQDLTAAVWIIKPHKPHFTFYGIVFGVMYIMLYQFCFTNLNHLQTHPYKSLLLSVFYLSVAVLSVTSYTL